jgi:uncharacterized protein (DUF302 family)
MLVLGCSALAQAAPLSATKTTNMADAIDGLTAAAQDSGYQLVKVQPIDQALAKRGYPDPGVRILFIGKSSAMEQAMKTDPKLLSVLPFRLTLIVESKQIVVSSDDLEIWKEMFPEAETARLIEAWQHDLKVILSDFSAR